jgi:hypothetical protein
LRTKLFGLLALAGLTGFAHAEEYSSAFAGHEIVVSRPSYLDQLRVDGQLVAEDSYVVIKATGTVSGIPVVIGTTNCGGSSCGDVTFVLTIPSGELPKIESLERDATEWKIHDDRIELLMPPPTGAHQGFRWNWTPKDGFKQIAVISPSPKGGTDWSDLSKLTQTLDLFDNAVIAPKLNTLLAKENDRDDFLAVDGPGDVKISKGQLVFTTCQAHNCPNAGTIVVVDPKAKKLYLAWKPYDDRPIIVRPVIGKWPKNARVEFNAWSAPYVSRKTSVKPLVSGENPVFKIDRFTVKDGVGEAIIKFTNRTGSAVSSLWVKCAFIGKDGVAIDTGLAHFMNIGKDETAYEEVHGVSAFGAEKVQCRIES